MPNATGAPLSSDVDMASTRPEARDNRSQRGCGWFFIFLAALSLVLACTHPYSRRWGPGSALLAGVFFFSGIAWLAFTPPSAGHSHGGEGGIGRSGAGRPVPISPPTLCQP